MISRFVFFAALLLFPAQSRAEPAAEKAVFAPKLIIYLAKGPANSCGIGCNSWIAVEGHVDPGASSRIRRFLAAVKDAQRPIYFHSPGGAVGAALEIGRLLRSRKAIARVGRTIVAGCAAGTQVDEACLKIKSGRGEVEAEIATRNSMCNSACGYMFLGAMTREVALDAAMAVHSSKLTVVVRGHATAQQVANFRDRLVAKDDRDRASFVVSMGINHELNDLIRTVKFENSHVLTRPELFRFGIDTRPFAETPWMLVTGVRPYVRKIGVVKQADGPSFRTVEWRLFCEKKEHARLTFIREFDPGAAGTSSLVMKADTVVAFGKFPTRVGQYEMWNDTLAPDAIKAMLAASTLQMQMRESLSTADGKSNLATFDIDTNGLEASWTQLLVACSNNVGQPAAASSSLISTPAK
jgi:hypothetical protein